jgi:NAD(P)H-hydrate epimerase
MELFTISEMQKADGLAIEADISGIFLMEQAGLRVTSHIERISEGPCRVTIIAGPGNNGGDAFVVARRLKERAYKIDIFELCLKDGQTGRHQSDAKFMKEKWLEMGEEIHSLSDVADIRESLDQSSMLIDGLFGAGLNRDIEEPISSIINEINQANLDVLAIDIPSGVSGNTGQIMGTAIQSSYTCTFHRPKQGHYLYPGRDLCGELHIENIGIPHRVNIQLSPKQKINSPEIWSRSLDKQTINSHKYHNGSVLVISGDQTMQGAAVLSANAAVKAGAGLVTMTVNKKELQAHPKSYAAIMLAKLPEGKADEVFHSFIRSKKITASLIGPGSMPDIKTQERALALLKTSKRVVFDAGALTAFKGKQELLSAGIKNREVSGEASRKTLEPTVVLTPHEGEFKTLFPDLDVKNKIEAAREAAKRMYAVIVLKGADTVIASPDGRVIVNANAPATLASAGTGDVLAGIITGLIANTDRPLFEAAAAAVYIHGECANKITTGLVADELIDHIADMKQALISHS